MKKAPVWQKRFKTRIHPFVLQFTSSIPDDEELVVYDIVCSIAHIRMLAKKGIISRSDYKKIKNGLEKILSDYKKGKFKLLPEYEDVHMNIEFQLKKIIGGAAEKLHTARSRNDLIATDLRLYCRSQIIAIALAIVQLQEVLLQKAIEYKKVIIPGYTHLQQAQPILSSFYLCSLFYKFQRDLEQLLSLIRWVNVLPLGSCAFAGTGIEIEQDFIARRLAMERISENALDAVSDRDFLCDTIYYLTRVQVHLSQLAEDFIIFCTEEFKIVELDDSIATGSSIMPQKKNPDVFELLRARAGNAIGNLTGALTILKGLPNSYNRDLQELKHILFAQVKQSLNNLNMATTAVHKIKFQTNSNEWMKKPDWMCINDLIDFFVKEGYPFRKIYNQVSKAIDRANNDMDKFISLLVEKTKTSSDTIRKMLTPEFSIKNKISSGGTGFDAVKKQIIFMRRLLSKNRTMIENCVKLNGTVRNT